MKKLSLLFVTNFTRLQLRLGNEIRNPENPDDFSVSCGFNAKENRLGLRLGGEKMKKKVYAIVSPEGHIYTIHYDRHRTWNEFFSLFPYRAPMDEGIKAYECLGYKLTEFYLISVEDMDVR